MIAPLSVLVFAPSESPDVRGATIVVRMMKRKKVATGKFSNLDSSILILVEILQRMFFATFSRSSEWSGAVVLVVVEDL